MSNTDPRQCTRRGSNVNFAPLAPRRQPFMHRQSFPEGPSVRILNQRFPCFWPNHEPAHLPILEFADVSFVLSDLSEVKEIFKGRLLAHALLASAKNRQNSAICALTTE